jgi:ComEC/Rec2-related protein
MTLFILFTVSYLTGMSLAVFLERTSGGFFLLLTMCCTLAGAIPFWQSHSEKILAGAFAEIWEDEEPLPILTILLLLGAVFFFGTFRYADALAISSPKHLARVLEKTDDQTRWRLVGRIVEEPTLKSDFLEVLIAPESIREVPRLPKKPATGTKKGTRRTKKKSDAAPAVAVSESEPEPPPPPVREVQGGFVLAQVYEESPAFQSVKFNQTVSIEGTLSEPGGRRNPGALDYARFLRNRNIFRTVRIVGRRGRGARLEVLGDDPSGAWWYRFALGLRERILLVIKQTMPYPESSFLGGVLLGLRGGLPKQVSTEFRMTGVSHVLAVSGLHVTIIAGLFYGLFMMFRVPLRVFAPIIIFCLFTFALIVGWPSSAVRAALMNSLFLLSRAYLSDYGFKLSVVFSLSVAAVYILTLSPLQLTEPSFVLSVMAIYALALFTDPAENLLRRVMRGAGLGAAALMTALFFLAIMIKRDLVTHPWFFPGSAVWFIGLIFVADRLSRQSTFSSFSYEMLPNWLQSFTASQVAIFLAMMGPLSAFYFGQMSLAAPLANMIAIPLIGIIVQIGLIAGLIGSFLPVIGLPLALVFNAANWLAVKFFLGMAHLFAVIIPFPRISQPSFGLLVLYYLILHLVFYWRTLLDLGRAILAALSEIWEDEDYRLPIGLTVGVVCGTAMFIGGVALSRFERRPAARVTQLDVGYGSSILVEQGGRAVLLDSGFHDSLGGYDAGDRVILPALSGKMITHLDAVILSSPLPERIGGLQAVLEQYRVGEIHAPFWIPTDGKQLRFSEYLERFNLGDQAIAADIAKGRIPHNPPNYFWESALSSFNALSRLIAQRRIPVHHLTQPGQIPVLNGAVQFLGPVPKGDAFHVYFDGGVFEIGTDKGRILYSPGSITAISRLPERSPAVFLFADIPYPWEDFLDLVGRTSPAAVGISYRTPSAWVIDNYKFGTVLKSRSMRLSHQPPTFAASFFITQSNGALQVDLRGERWQTRPFLKESPERKR